MADDTNLWAMLLSERSSIVHTLNVKAALSCDRQTPNSSARLCLDPLIPTVHYQEKNISQYISISLSTAYPTASV